MDYASTCALTKSPENERKGYGENVFIYNVPNAVPADAFKAMAWANSVKIGCGIQTCGMKSFVVCRYSPPGNVLNQTIYPIGDVCSGCKAACNESEGLCM
ncbi:hypothetical protein ANCCEY_01689 [Ancylostoma ceylanicum]|uniref:SCP domain-containing protein n=1 Tax=Ancylostoma ceylanicum TaxID=53326 RepID=A0A0D6M9Y4_9BILA|nr:hypothetical protein ANCCEY_01689 [Ancylostoma ceylanicum]